METANGKLGVLVVGLGAVTTTFMAGTLMYRKGLGLPGGSVTQMAKIRVGRGKDRKYLKVSEIVPLTDCKDIEFGSWDIFPMNAYESAMNAKVLLQKDIDPVRDELESIKPMKAAFDPEYVSRLAGQGGNIKDGDRAALVEQLREDIRKFKSEHGCDRVVVIWAASTEKFIDYNPAVHSKLEDFENAIKTNDKANIAPSMLYAYAALQEGAPFVMGAPNICVDIPAIWELADKKGLPIAGKDFKTGQTLMKTVLSPMLRTRCLGLSGWFSTNILGNRDGEVLDAPENFKTKEVSKLGVIDTILKKEDQPELYGDIFHKVRINYYPPRGDAKEGWDNLDIFGWMGQDYGMQIKVDFLCRDSILAAPIVLDLVLCSDLALRAGLKGTQRWMSFFLKSPMHDYTQGEEPIHDLFQQYTMFKNKIRELGGYEPDEELE
ncbi:inositol-3-phosphate synthase [Pseudoprevotella muciniphila]|uniref:Inositol-3-phosphate synthase n=1 Tax=Pseudoprevotella muciniphila TaxID=2133944 RepID=A0A5P8E7J7_9BACT|nr:inositol-3-phosphate synthase [Pseudoprevotella muciniphila]QFQ12860.1 inositol-3-phosphate synthase [Pseudoprevotella muciniphila]